MICPECKNNMIWSCDFDYEDYGLEGDGIVSNFSCNNNDCNVDDLIIHQKT